MTSVRLYDTLRFHDDSTGDVSLRCRHVGARSADGRASEAIPSGEDNLVVRAARLLKKHTGTARGVMVDLWKRIPSAAGLGGGSSDAAATLAALNRLWELHLSQADLASLAARLGSDVPFFLGRSASAICRGRGEVIESVEIPAGLWFVIVRPPSGLSTADVYGHLQAGSPANDGSQVKAGAETGADNLICHLQRGEWGRAATFLHNALQVPAERLSDDVVRLKAEFSRQPVCGHLMSGSGSAYFGLCAGRRQARHVAARIRAARIGRVFVASGGA